LLLLDDEIFKSILRMTTNILKNNFFYSDGALKRFFNCFNDLMQEEYSLFEIEVEDSFRFQLKTCDAIKKDFTCYFVSFYLHDVLMYDLHFTEMELEQFQNLLPSFIGDKQNEQTGKRAHH
jgi:hypothetical protein